MQEENNRRSFLKKLTIGGLGTAMAPTTFLSAKSINEKSIDDEARQSLKDEAKRQYNASYQGEYLNRLAFPIGGMGAGMILPRRDRRHIARKHTQPS